MYKIFSAIFLMLCITTFAQQRQKSFTIDWKDKVVYDAGDQTQEIPGFDSSNMDYSISGGLYYSAEWDESQKINAQTGQLINLRYQVISVKELKNLDPATIPSRLQYRVRTATARGVNAGFVRMSPIIKEGNVYKKVLSFDVSYTVSGGIGNQRVSGRKKAITNSILTTGTWYRFSVAKTGVHKITTDFLSSLGIDVSTVDANTIKIYSHGGKSLPLLNRANTNFDPPQIPIQLRNINGNRLQAGSDILFYGESTLGYVAENDSHINPYDDTSYYYLTFGGATGKRISTAVLPSSAATLNVSTYKSRKYIENDAVSISKSGRRWFGDAFNVELQRTYEFSFPNLIITEPIDVTVKAAGSGGSSSQLNVVANRTSDIGEMAFGPTSYPELARERTVTGSFNSSTNDVTISLEYNQGGNPENTAYLDYIQVDGMQQINSSDRQIEFTLENSDRSGTALITVAGTNNVSEIWEVTDTENVTRILNNAGNSMNFKSRTDKVRTFVTVQEQDLFSPVSLENSRVANQNLKGTILKNSSGAFEDLDYLVLTNSTLLPVANRLVDFHNNNSGLKAKAVSLDLIYNEFSTGKTDISAIRNFIRYIYDNASTPENRLKYLCLLGDASVDYKNTRLQTNNNIVPLFETLQSSDLSRSFATDDFYAMMDPDEGQLRGGGKLDLAVGRILADTPALANQMVDKIIAYQSEKAFGSWRNRHLYIADDVDRFWEKQIQGDLNRLADEVDVNIPSVNVQKIYADAFKQQTIAGGRRYPKVNDAILNAMDNGVLVTNYFGHGGETGLASELIYTKASSQKLSNENKYPLFITVTCNFTKFDNPETISAGELTFWNPEGGAVSMITTTREITVTAGIDLNNNLTKFLYPADEVYPTIAESVVSAKNSFRSSASRVVFYIGDPAMKLAIPKTRVQLTKVNDKVVGATTEVDTLKALSRIKLSGTVLKGTEVDTDFNGVLSTVIYDKEVTKSTLANDNTRENADGSGAIVKLDFKDLGGIIFRGKASITKGAFDFEFIVPKDIKIPVGSGRVSFYAIDAEKTIDLGGRNTEILIGDINLDAPEDLERPGNSIVFE